MIRRSDGNETPFWRDFKSTRSAGGSERRFEFNDLEFNLEFTLELALEVEKEEQEGGIGGESGRERRRNKRPSGTSERNTLARQRVTPPGMYRGQPELKVFEKRCYEVNN